MKPPSPFFTVIIAVLNSSSTLERCLKSIIEQEYVHKEIIVIDGGSTDDSLSIINNYCDHFSYWETAPDRGIYHAWNKALKHARGEWICFLGADDYFWSADVLDCMLPYLKKAKINSIKLVYGQLAKIDAFGQIVSLRGKNWKKISWLMPHGMPLSLPHPGLMHHSTIFKKYGLFDETFKIAGDYEFLLRELITGKALYARSVRVVGSDMGGLADSHNLLATKEVARARKKHGLSHFSWFWYLVYIRTIIRTGWRKLKNHLYLRITD